MKKQQGFNDNIDDFDYSSLIFSPPVPDMEEEIFIS